MIRNLLLICLAILWLDARTQISEQSNLMSGKYSIEELKKLIIPRDKWTPFPKLNDREGWAKADQAMMKRNLAEAEKLLDFKWPSLPATTTLLYVRTGDRDEYQSVSFSKRIALITLVFAEIYENKGRFTDQIINGIWSICEESYWGVPAHLGSSHAGSGLPDVTDPYVDLFSAETATFMAWTDYFMGEKLDAVSPQIRKRIYDETNKRIFTPVMSWQHSWMGPNSAGRRPNNWNPWICSNWLNTALLLEKDENRRVEMVAKILRVLDEFLNPYPQDGGCDEGPSYWGAAAASLFDNVSILNLASNNSFNYVFSDEKVKNMGRFIYRAYIGGKYFLNFADADPQPLIYPNMIYRFGKAIGDRDMMKFGAWFRPVEPEVTGVRTHLFRTLFSLFMQPEYAAAEKGIPFPQDVWLPDLQVFAARDKQGSSDGFFVAAKGGNNDESHNHNDIGNFVVYYNGQPLLIDVGRGTYTSRTFSSKRYDIWFNRSDFHNLPTVNGKTQEPGAAFKAMNVNYSMTEKAVSFSLDISKSYPDDAGIISWIRTIQFNRGKNVVIDDAALLKSAGEITHHLMTTSNSEVVKPGELVLHFKDAGGTAKDFVVRYNASQMEATVEKMRLTAMEDKGILTKWGDTVYRISFRVKQPKTKDRYRFEILPG